MGLPKGTNNGVVGKKGRSGRKSAYQELADAKRLHELWFGEWNLEQLQELIESGTYSPEMRMQLWLMKGNTRLMEAMLSKIYADKSELKIEAKKRLEAFLGEDDESADKEGKATE